MNYFITRPIAIASGSCSAQQEHQQLRKQQQRHQLLCAYLEQHQAAATAATQPSAADVRHE